MSAPGTESGAETTSPQNAMTSQPRGSAVLKQMGGVRGLIYSSLPVLVFVPVSSAFGLLPAIGAAVAVATLILLWRLLRRDSVQPAISGFIAVGVSALIAYLVGASKGYFLLGIWMSLFWAVVFTASVVIRRPLVGYIWGWVNSHDRRWRGVRRAVLAFDLATLVWVAVFSSRFVVQHHLYDTDKTGWLGVARIAMGWPLTAVAALVTYLAIRAAQRALHEHDATNQPDAAFETDRSESSRADGAQR
ncbi:membrane protein [Mycolicibacterium cyprinidarum]|uniref:Membrane protein n=1 Tax=Mycolicibacterium cyprinidarum TaxID=2860311 RepID=A0ABQ4VEH6_9MYCO|nr:membrane protein [Mycolicibacterium sp. NGTWS0302]GJF17244.1 membrane protein [Mycolicibacterium sp. NGTWSNA01]GJF18308.1 membrane protein [Mycolicibacterium sp. NGTWS1803]